MTFLAAARACSSVSAATMAMASPNWKIFSLQRIGRSQPSPLLVGKVIRPVMAFLPPTSFQVMIRSTPSIFSASAVSIPLMMAWLTSACTRARRSVPAGIFSATSAPKSQVPVTLATARRTDVFGAENGAVFLGLRHDVVNGLLATHDRGGIHHRVDQRLVASAAAEVAVAMEPRADFLAGRVEVLVQQGLGRHDETGRADAALGAAVGHPGNLQRMQVLRRYRCLRW